MQPSLELELGENGKLGEINTRVEMSPCHVLMGGSDINVMIFMKYIFRMI